MPSMRSSRKTYTGLDRLSPSICSRTLRRRGFEFVARPSTSPSFLKTSLIARWALYLLLESHDLPVVEKRNHNEPSYGVTERCYDLTPRYKLFWPSCALCLHTSGHF